MNKREESIRWHMNYCAHYQRKGGSGRGEACKAGMVYDEVSRNTELGFTGCGLRLPCLRSNHDDKERRGQPLCECPKLLWTTREQAEAQAEETDRAVARMMATMPLVARMKAEHKGENWSGVVACPSCPGRLRIAIAASNGHTRGKCETEGCLSWIE